MDARIYSTGNGQVIRKIPENEILVEFGNISWRLTMFQFRLMQDFINKIDGKYFIEINKDSYYKRKIRIPIKNTNLSILFNLEELEDLRALIGGIPEIFLEQYDLFDDMYLMADNAYDRFENISRAIIGNIKLNYNLN